jgi:hypothetical protein
MQPRKLILLSLTAFWSTFVAAHGGGLDANGCHTNRKTGDYHCHRAPSMVAPQAAKPAAQGISSAPSMTKSSRTMPPGCHVGPRGGTYTITKSGKKNYGGC